MSMKCSGNERMRAGQATVLRAGVIMPIFSVTASPRCLLRACLTSLYSIKQSHHGTLGRQQGTPAMPIRIPRKLTLYASTGPSELGHHRHQGRSLLLLSASTLDVLMLRYT